MRSGIIVLALSGLLLLGQVNTESDSSFTTLAAKASEARDADRLDEAVALYKKALALRPAWAEGWWYLGTLLYDQDAYAGAASAFQKVVELRPEDGNAFAMLGLSEVKLGHNQDALAHLQKGRQLGLSDDALRNAAVYNEGVLLVESGAFQKAEETLDTLCRKGVDQPELIMALGSAVLGIPASKVPPDDKEIRDMLWQAGWAEHFAAQRDQPAAALREYQKLVADFPKHRNVQFAYGRFLLEKHYDAEALEAFKRELQNSPSHLLARLGIAGIDERTDPAAGLPYAEEAVKMSPKLAEGHYLLGMLLFDTGNTTRAITELETAQRSTPDDPRVYFGLGRAYAQVHRNQDAAHARAMFVRLNKQGEEDQK
ncbi:MAG: tetratricopeptide repeat protein [Acidobacteriaceae bacterium]|nr:tetratricopeptide repeat protein [Acidobacteriaceae bacterium]